MKEMEEIAAKEDQERTEVQRRIRDETNAFMQDMIQNKERREREEKERQMAEDKRIVEQVVREAMAEREAQIQHIQEQHKQAIQDYQDCVKAVEEAKAREKEAAELENQLIAKYQKEQEEKDRERLEAQRIKTQAFDDLLQKMAAYNKNREDKLKKMEDLRIEIATFMEEEKNKQREEDEHQKRLQMQEELLQAIDTAR